MYVAVEGAIDTLNCTGSNLKIIAWFHNGTALSPQRSRMFTSPQLRSELLIPDVKFSDSGQYVCQGILSFGRKVQDSVTLYVYSKPKAKVSPQRLIISADQTAVSTCNATGSPPPEVRWFAQKNDQQLLVAIGSTLIVNGFSLSTVNDFVCEATNKAGVSVAHLTIEIKDVVYKVNITGDKPGLLRETSVSLPCITTSESKIEEYYERGVFFWRKGDLTLTNIMPRIKFKKTNLTASLIISELQYSDSGVYTCTVVLDTSAESWSTRIVVVGPPAPPSKAWISVSCGAGFDMLWTNSTFDGNSFITGYRITLIKYYVNSGNITVRTLEFPSLSYVFVEEPEICMNCSLLGVEIQSVSDYGLSTSLFVNHVAISDNDEEDTTKDKTQQTHSYCSAHVQKYPVFQRFPKFQIPLKVEDSSCDTVQLTSSIKKAEISIFNQKQLQGINLTNSSITASESKTQFVYRASVGGFSLLEVLYRTERLRNTVWQVHSVALLSCALEVDLSNSNCSFLYLKNEVTPCSFIEKNPSQEKSESGFDIAAVAVGCICFVLCIIIIICGRKRSKDIANKVS